MFHAFHPGHLIRRLLPWALLLGVASTWAQGFPSKPVRIVIPFATGGSTDANARIIQDKLSQLWGQPVV
ncbi:MAG: tripartite tricarboxylate transporter substrate binding protein, partial [Limnohabitans sp.]